MPLLSIFMPTYNAGKFVSKAIESVLNQTFIDFEFVICDDGSSDNTYDICEKYAEKDARICLTKGIHGTLFKNMNQFLLEANGSYIGFIDHDDYLDENYFQCMMQHLMTTDADCAISSYTLVDSNYQVLPWYTPTLKDGEIIDSKEAHRRFLTSLDIEGFRWNKIYKRSIISAHDFRFPQISLGDICGEFELLSYIDTAVLVDSKAYYYRQSATSQVASGNIDFVNIFLNVYKNIGEKAVREGLKAEGQYYITWRTVNTLFNAFKERKKYQAEGWKYFRIENGPKKRLHMSLSEAMHILNQYDNKRDSRVKFLIKTMIVYLVYH